MIHSKNITKKYGTTQVLNIEELEIPKGQSFGLVGNNGAGKTTFFNILLDIIRPTTGEVIKHDVTVNKNEAWKSITGSIIDENFIICYVTQVYY